MSDAISEQVSVRLNEQQKQILDHVQESYPALSRGGLFLQLLHEWDWAHRDGNGKSARLIRIEAEVNQLSARVSAIEQTLIEVLKLLRQGHDTDHA